VAPRRIHSMSLGGNGTVLDRPGLAWKDKQQPGTDMAGHAQPASGQHFAALAASTCPRGPSWPPIAGPCPASCSMKEMTGQQAKTLQAWLSPRTPCYGDNGPRCIDGHSRCSTLEQSGGECSSCSRRLRAARLECANAMRPRHGSANARPSQQCLLAHDRMLLPVAV
jgi:hypothetical protein